MICPQCKNIMKQDGEFPTIWYCNNKKCDTDSVTFVISNISKKLRLNRKITQPISLEEERKRLIAQGVKFDV